MNRIDKLRRNIETLKDSLALDGPILLTHSRTNVEEHLEWCLTEMGWCLTEMKRLSERLHDPNPN
jgi:hypothetical protein